MACNIKRSKAQYSRGLSFFCRDALYCGGAYMQPHVSPCARTHTQSLGPFISGFIFDINLRRGV